MKGAFLGILLILWGVLMILKSVLNVNLPIFRILAASVFIYIGVSIFWGGFGLRMAGGIVIFDDRRITVSNRSDEYNIIFGRGTMDMGVVSPDNNPKIEINTIFGEGIILVNPEVPMVVTVSSAFGSGRLPGGDTVFFGESRYESPSYKPGEKAVEIKANVVFGTVSIATGSRTL